MKNLVILGCGGVGSFIAHAIQEINKIKPTWNIIGFVDDDQNKGRTNFAGMPFLGISSWLEQNPDVAVVIALSDPFIKYQLLSKLQRYGCTDFPAIVHPSTWIANDVSIGDGCIIYPGTSINVGCKIGKFVMVNMNCAIGHDVKVGDYSFLAPNVGIGGNTMLAEGCTIGIGASILQQITIGSWATVGAGAVVTDHIKEQQTVVGIPAKPIHRV